MSVNEKLPTGKRIAITTDGIGDKIYVDGNYIGVSPITPTLSFGNHEVTAVRNSKESKKTIIVAQNGGITSVKLMFFEGAINGVFSVSSTKKVVFSKGDLQYQASTNTWRFAEHQWDYIGDANSNITQTSSGWIDLFGFGTVNTPTKISKNSSDYSSFNDWGNNTIQNGGNKKWFTLTKDEWVYVFNTRNTNSGIRYAKATVNGVSGVILLPDNWNSNNYKLRKTNTWDASFSSNRISQSDWISKLEANGAVFLPCVGHRDGTYVYVGYGSSFWSATYNDSESAYSVYFCGAGVHPAYNNYRKFGLAVRLVCDVEE